VYEQNYSVSTISKQLRELADQHGEELLERRHDAWPRLLTAFELSLAASGTTKSTSCLRWPTV